MIRRHYELVIFAPKNKGISNRMYWRIVFAFAGIKRDDDGRMQTIVRISQNVPQTRVQSTKLKSGGERKKNVVWLRTDGTVADYRVRLPRLRLSNKIQQEGTRDKIGIRKDGRRGGRRLEGGRRR